MGQNTKSLITTLEALNALDDRYSNIRVVNRDRDTGERDGHDGALSVIFQATDNCTGAAVAIKFFDPDFQGFGARYRMALFERESNLLERLRGKGRCLQLVQPLSEVPISVEDRESGRSITVECGYFVLEWLDGDIREYFLRQHMYEAEIKLQLFRLIVRGVFALHRHDIAHRDLKHDNLRRARRDNRDLVLPIDFGAAVDLVSAPLGETGDYAHPVGAPAFAPIEAHLGLSRVRELAIYTDIFGLGCILHDLFNADYFFARAHHDIGFNECFGACRAHMMRVQERTPTPSTDDLIREWQSIIQLTKGQVSLPTIDSAANSVPAGISPPLDRLLRSLTDIDYRRRETGLERILRMVDSALTILHNRFAEQRERDRREWRRLQKKKKLDWRQERQRVNLANNLLAET